jgi:lysophospholipase L1-like esterase
MLLDSAPRQGIVLILLLATATAGTTAAFSTVAQAADPAANANVQLRGSLDNARVKFELDKRGHVAFMGGSITEMNGYRPMVCEILKKRFPRTEFTFTDAGIASTCSTTGAFRLARDVLDKGPVDLFFVEFAVNDDQDARHTRAECIRGMEGIVRHALTKNPDMDIVIVYFVNEDMLAQLQQGRTPLTIEAHAQVAEHYGVSTINLAREVAQQITAGTLTWKQFGGTHPAPLGNAICAKMIDELFDRTWKEPLSAGAGVVPHKLPDPLDPLNYCRGRFIEPKQAMLKQGWQLQVPPWKQLAGSCRERFRELTMLCGDGAGAELTLQFEGTAIGAYVLAGPDAGTLDVRVDDGPASEVDLYHHFSKGLHYPRTVMLAADLRPGRHVLTLRIGDKTTSKGHAARILEFVAN